jgi:hypothetical protein
MDEWQEKVRYWSRKGVSVDETHFAKHLVENLESNRFDETVELE